MGSRNAWYHVPGSFPQTVDVVKQLRRAISLQVQHLESFRILVVPDIVRARALSYPICNARDVYVQYQRQAYLFVAPALPSVLTLDKCRSSDIRSMQHCRERGMSVLLETRVLVDLAST